MPSTVYKGDLAEVTFGHETGIVLSHGHFGGLAFSIATSGDVSTITFSGASAGFFDSLSRLRYPVGMLAGSRLRVIGGGDYEQDDFGLGHIYTIVENSGTTIKVTPAMKETGASASGDSLVIESLATPTLDSGMAYDDGADASDETVLTDQFVGLAATLSVPETTVEVLRSHVVGVGRNVVVQEPQKMVNSGGSLETMMHSARWFYYALGAEAVVAPSTVKATVSPTAAAIAAGDTYVSFGSAISNDPLVGEYIVVEDTDEVVTPYEDEPAARTKWTGTQTQFHSSIRTEMRRVIAIDETVSADRRIYVDDPFCFDHTAGKTVKVVAFEDAATNGSPNFDTTAATFGTITNRQKRAMWTSSQIPSFALEQSLRTHDVNSYGTGGHSGTDTYTGSQTNNAPGDANDSKQFTRVFRGCKVKSFELKADAEAAVMMKVDFDALNAYTDTGRLEDVVLATATITVTDGDAANGMTAAQKIHIVSSDGTKKDYFISDNNDGGPATGAVVAAGDTLKSTGSVVAGAVTDSDTTGVAIGLNLAADTQSTMLADLKAAIEHANGHNGKITVSAVSGTGDGNQTITLTQVAAIPSGNTTITENIANTAATNFTGGQKKGDRFTAHRMFENVGNGPSERKAAGIAPNTEKPFFYYNGTITAFGIALAQITNFSLSGTNGIQTLYTVRGNPQAESRNAGGQSLEQVPFAGSRNASLQVEGKVEYEMNLGIIVTDPLLFHEFRTNRTHGYSEPITLHLVKNGAGANREEVYVVIDDYIISEAPLQIPEDKGPIKTDLKILPKHVKVIAYDTLLHS